MEQKERLLAVDEELVDDEDKEIKKKEALVSQERRETIDEGCTRKLLSIDETSKLSFTLIYFDSLWYVHPTEKLFFNCQKWLCDCFDLASQLFISKRLIVGRIWHRISGLSRLRPKGRWGVHASWRLWHLDGSLTFVQKFLFPNNLHCAGFNILFSFFVENVTLENGL